MAGIDLPEQTVARSIAEAIQVLVHIERRAGSRYVSEIVSMERYDSHRDQYEFTDWEM